MENNKKMLTERKYDEASVEVSVVDGQRVITVDNKDMDNVQVVNVIWNRQENII